MISVVSFNLILVFFFFFFYYRSNIRNDRKDDSLS